MTQYRLVAPSQMDDKVTWSRLSKCRILRQTRKVTQAEVACLRRVISGSSHEPHAQDPHAESRPSDAASRSLSCPRCGDRGL